MFAIREVADASGRTGDHDAAEPMPYRTANTRDLVLAHRVYRRFVRYLTAVTPGVRVGDRDAAGAVADFAGELTAALRDHQATQDALLWPALLGYLGAVDQPDQAARVMAIADQQRVVRAALTDLAAVLERFRATAGAAEREELAGLLERLRIALETQFAVEENEILPLAERYMTHEQWAAIGRRFAFGLPAERRPFHLGALLREGSRRERALLRGKGSSAAGRLTALAACRAFDREFARLEAVLGAERA